MEGKFLEGQQTAKRGRHLALGHLGRVEKPQGLGSEDVTLGLSTDNSAILECSLG